MGIHECVLTTCAPPSTIDVCYRTAHHVDVLPYLYCPDHVDVQPLPPQTLLTCLYSTVCGIQKTFSTTTHARV